MRFIRALGALLQRRNSRRPSVFITLNKIRHEVVGPPEFFKTLGITYGTVIIILNHPTFIEAPNDPMLNLKLTGSGFNSRINGFSIVELETK